jgi:transcriptional regulator with XRE-family HTH domain
MKNKLKEIRFYRNLRQIDLQKMSGIDTARISYIENEVFDPTENEKKKLMKALNLGIDEIFPTIQE